MLRQFEDLPIGINVADIVQDYWFLLWRQGLCEDIRGLCHVADLELQACDGFLEVSLYIVEVSGVCRW